MKATKLIAIIAAAAMLAACSSDGTSPEYNTPASASFSGGITNTRTSISSNVATWKANDAIGITAAANGGGATNYTNEKYIAASPGSSTTFNYNSDNAGKQIFYQDANTVNFTAYYPFKGTADGASGTDNTGNSGTTGPYISYTIQSTDETTDKQPTIDYLYASTPNVASRTGVNFTFNHMMSELTLQFSSSLLSVANQSFTVSGVNFLTGMFNTATGVAAINGSTASSLTLTTDGTGASTIIVYPNSALKTGMIVEVKISGVTYKANLDFTAINPAVGEGSATDGMLPGKNYTFNITVNATGLTVNGQSISGWTQVSNNVSAAAE